MTKNTILALFVLLLLSCNSKPTENINELKYQPVWHSGLLLVVDENYQEFPTLIKFTRENIVISRFQNSEQNPTGYENVNLNILKRLYVDDKDNPITIYNTDFNPIKISGNKKKPNVFYVDGLNPGNRLTVIGIDKNTFQQIENLM